MLKRYKGKIVRHEEFTLWQSGQEALRRATAKAESIVAEARSKAHEERARGYTAGVREARNEQSQLMIESIMRRDAYLSAVEPELADVVINAIQKVIGDLNHATLARAAVEQALRELKDQTTATVRVHPDQYSFIKEASKELIGLCPQLSILRIEMDARVRPGACILTSGQGIIESDPEQQLRVLREAVRRVAKRADSSLPPPPAPPVATTA